MNLYPNAACCSGVSLAQPGGTRVGDELVAQGSDEPGPDLGPLPSHWLHNLKQSISSL